MTYVEIRHSTTTDPTDINNNFYHIAQGSRLPFGTDFESTDGVYSIGGSSGSYMFDTFYGNDIDLTGDLITSNASLWVMLTQSTLDDTSTSVEFTGLNGDIYEMYRLFYRIYCDTISTFKMTFNSDSSTSYRSTHLYGQSTTATTTYDYPAGGGYISIGSTSNTGTSCFGVLSLHTEVTDTPNFRFMIGSCIEQANDTHVEKISEIRGLWTNTADTVTSIKVISSESMRTGTTFLLWGRR
ncbi:MAG: hypothetical protein GY853_02310 [PVC group bacterium]|nr:hypothetical protein [PVC group bacterium]